MSEIITRSFRVNIIILKFVGFYDDNKHTILRKIWTYVLYCLSLFIITLLAVKLFVGENDDFHQWSRPLISFATSASCYLKFIPFMINGPRIKNCINFFGDKQFAAKNEPEKKIEENCVNVCNRNFKIYFSLIVVLEFSWNLMPFFEEKQMFPLDIWLPCDLSSKPVLFYAIYWYCAAGIYTIRLK